MKNKILKLIALVMLTAFTLSAVPVFAASSGYTEEELQALLTSTEDYVSQIMALDDAQLDEVAAYSEFNMVSAEAVKEAREDLGGFIGVIDGQISQDGEVATITVNVDCETLDAEVVVTYDTAAASPLNFTINPDYPLSVNMANAARNTIIGLAVVFLILIFLTFVIGLLKYVNPEYRKGKGEVQADKTPAEEEKTQTEPVISTASNDDEIAAVIAAAIAAASADGTDASNYVVSSIKKVGTGKRWKRS